VLDDDKQYFPRYDAVLLYRLDVPQRFPQAWHAMRGLQGTIKADDMIAMNAQAELDGQSFARLRSRGWPGWTAQPSTLQTPRSSCATVCWPKPSAMAS
jgi:osmoprotectant transport system permease protein